MELTPCLGIGDCLMMKMCRLDLKRINISTRLIRIYRNDQERFTKFITLLLCVLFPKAELRVVDAPYVAYNKEKLCPVIATPYIMDELSSRLRPTISLNLPPFIIFHTKLRLSTLEQSKTFVKNDLHKLRQFFKTFKANKMIMIMGERTMEDCIETRLLGMTSLYNEIKELSAHNHIVDRTKEVLISWNPNFNDFTNEICLINKADLNVTFGIGGPLSMCQAFSKNTLCYTGKFDEFPWNKRNYRNLVETIDDLISGLTQRVGLVDASSPSA